jgi:membrane fusion protein, copper/silver efflux system
MPPTDPIDRTPVPDARPVNQEGGLRAPPGLGFLGKTWWWFHFLILVKLARLRFVVVLVVIGLVVVKWDTLSAIYQRWTRPADTAEAATGDVEYFCPMHPAIVRDNPHDKCPICFMNLSKRKKGEQFGEALPPGVVNRVQLSPYRVVQAGVRTSRVAYLPLVKEIVTTGSVEFNERLTWQVAARFKARIDKLVVKETGQNVEPGDTLAIVYSPELSTMQNLLDAHLAKNAELERTQLARLRLLDIGDDQVDEMLKSGKAPTHLIVRSRVRGHVIKKFVKEGQYVEEGAPLFDISDLSSIWIQGQVYEEDMTFLPSQSHFHGKPAEQVQGLPVTAATRAHPDQVFAGKLTFVYPHVDQDTRTVAVRFELANPEHKLRPGTTATVRIKVPAAELLFLTAKAADEGAMESALLGTIAAAPLAAGRLALLQRGLVLAVPDSAVIDTGALQIVYRQVVPGQFDGVQVKLGPRMSGPDGVAHYPVLRGLLEGDLIVTSGAFLIDAETRLNPAAGSIYISGSGSKGAGSSTVRPSTPEDEEAKIHAALAALGNATDQKLAQSQGSCPVLENSRLGSMGVPVKIVLDGTPVFLCCQGCVKEARSYPSKTLAKVQELRAKLSSPGGQGGMPAPSAKEAKIQAELAKLPAEERRAAELQRFCPVTNQRLGSMPMPISVMIQGERVFLCCKGCREDAEADPQGILAKVRQWRAKGQ